MGWTLGLALDDLEGDLEGDTDADTEGDTDADTDADGDEVGDAEGDVTPPHGPSSRQGLPSPVFRSGWLPCVHHLAVYLRPW